MNSIIKSSINIMIPILFAAMGGLFPALSGSLNIALEGLLLLGAFTSLAVFVYTGSLLFAVIAAAAAGIILSAIHAFAAFKIKANIIISGLAVNLLSAGLCIVLSEKIFKTKGVISISNEQAYLRYGAMSYELVYIYLYFALFLLLIMWVLINKTPFGFRLRACDKNKEALESLSINPQHYQITAILASGFLCGIGGSFLSLNLGSYVSGMSAGKGWIALVIIFLGARKPQGILIAAFFFGMAESLSNYAQGFLKIPSEFILIFPYVCTLIAMVILSIIKKQQKIVK